MQIIFCSGIDKGNFIPYYKTYFNLLRLIVRKELPIVYRLETIKNIIVSGILMPAAWYVSSKEFLIE